MLAFAGSGTTARAGDEDSAKRSVHPAAMAAPDGRAAVVRPLERGGRNERVHTVDDRRGCAWDGIAPWRRGRGSKQTADAVLGGVGPGECVGGAVQGLHGKVRHSDEIRVRPMD